MDFESSSVLVDRALKGTNKDAKIGLPKWNKTRVTYLTDIASKALKQLRSQSEWILPEHFVFGYSDGTMRKGTYWAKSFDRAMKRTGIARRGRNVRPHPLRHSMATALRNAGEDTEKIRASFSWADSTVMEGYIPLHIITFETETQNPQYCCCSHCNCSARYCIFWR